jgi:DNA (cytosine-5)-methyltransferase 1
MSRPRLLDLFCGNGGAAAGYARAGFDVTGIDHRPMPRYLLSAASAFVRADALVRQAVPPAYTEFIGRKLREIL